MRITTVLQRQHIGYFFKRHWDVQGKRTIRDTKAIKMLESRGTSVSDPQEYLKRNTFLTKKPLYTRVEVNLFQPELPLDEKHPEYKKNEIYLFNDSNILVQGMKQAQLLLKTLVFKEFPEHIEDSFQSQKLPGDVERSFQQSVLVSHLLDAEQQKTEKIVNPLRPMRPYPRNYGITASRMNMLLSHRLLNHCERLQGHTKTAERKTINNAFFVLPFERTGSVVQLEINAETFVTSKKAIYPVEKVTLEPKDDNLPEIHPLYPTASIPKVNFYNNRLVYPVKTENQFSHPHSILLHYSNLDVKNLYGTPVTPDQFESRALMKGFAVAASRAQSLYGSEVKVLKKPIVIQVVQFNGKSIQFGVFQLNTLALDSDDGVKNYWFSKPALTLYDQCCYVNGRPSFTSYNFDVLRLMNVFYNS